MPDCSGDAIAGGIYVHVPFCLKKCAYCNFYSVGDGNLQTAYVAALRKEIELRATEVSADFTADTLYFGGGTPSMLTPVQVRGIIDVVRHNYTLTTDTEITLEINPATADAAKLTAYRDLGVNRLSIGMQSFDDGMLRLLGRAHNAAESAAAFRDARRAGFDNISIDLIYGLPGQTPARLNTDIDRALALGAEHISAYMLTLEPETRLAQMLRNGDAPPLSEGWQRQAFDTVLRRLSDSGYEQYEISNFSRIDAGDGRDYRSRHNLKYWNFATYLGFGPAAHSYHAPNRRNWNVSDVTAYIIRLEQGKNPCEDAERLSPEQSQMEMIYLGLRQNRGIDLKAFDSVNPRGFIKAGGAALQKLLDDGYLSLQNNFCVLTTQGRPFLDYVTQKLVDVL